MPATVIIVYSGARFPGGAETYLESLFRLCDRERFRFVLASLGEWTLTERLRAQGEEVVVLPDRRIDPRTVVRLSALARGQRAVLIASQGVIANLYARAAARLTQLPHLATVHSDVRFDYGSPLRRLVLTAADRLLRSATVRFLVPSEHLRRRLVESGVAAERVSVVYHGVRPMAVVAGGGDPRPLVVGSVGRLHPTKGFDVLIRAGALLPPDVDVVIHGEGDERARLEGLVRELGLERRVRLPGFAADLDDAFRGIDVYVQPSRAEGFGLSVVEAMTAGLPVVVSSAGSLPELVDGVGTGLIVREDGPEALASCLRRLLEDDEQRRLMGRRAAEEARERFGIRRWIEETMEVYGMAADTGWAGRA